MAEEEKTIKKLRKAIEAGARLVEISSSKIIWDKGHDKIEVTSGELDYRACQILDCVADKIAQNHWFGQVFGINKEKNNEEPDRYIVVVQASEFKSFIGEQHLSSEYLIKIFEKIPDITLKGKTKIPVPISKDKWMDMNFYKDNICGVGVAHEDEDLAKYRSDRKLRGKGAGREEPVFVFFFSNAYGLAFFQNARERAGCQLQDPDLYHLPPRAQELFQAVRWNDGLIVLTTEQASKMMNLKWPVKQKTRLYERVGFIRKILKILKDNEFINYNNKTFEQGKTIEKKAWIFYTRKRKLIKNKRKIN